MQAVFVAMLLRNCAMRRGVMVKKYTLEIILA